MNAQGGIPDYASGKKLEILKHTLVKLGQLLPGRSPLHLQAALNYILLGHWLQAHGFNPEYRAASRHDLFDYVAKTIADRQTLYVEFGVFQGASIAYWSKLLRHNGSLLHGFDSFEGMPEDFDGRTGILKGTFHVGGEIPRIDDPRVRFFRGWFDDTLPQYEVPAHDQLVIHIDCDLYSATACVLKHMAPYIKEGAILIFDDMAQPLHEPRAFSEYMRDTGRHFRLIAADKQDHYAFECLG
jgi:hypothetical protein